MKLEDIKEKIEECTANTSLLKKKDFISAIEQAISLLDKGELRTAEKINGEWLANTWVKKAILLYFKLHSIKRMRYGYDYYDKIPLKKLDGSVRVVPMGSTVRYGSFLEPGVVVMAPSYINIGAFVGADTMIDSHVLIGSCAQIGKKVHISAGVIIGGVLEPPQATPVIVEDECFIGGQSGIYEGVIVKRRAVISSGVIINQSTPIFDSTNGKTYYGVVPENAVVIAGTLPKKTAFGELQLNAAIIIKYRDDKTDSRTALEQALR